MPLEMLPKHPECGGGEPFAVVDPTNDGELVACHPTRESARAMVQRSYAEESVKEVMSRETEEGPDVK